MKYAFIGLPSSGKSTLAKDVFKHFSSIYVPEMARTYIESLERPIEGKDNYRIAKLQSGLENELSKSKDDILICDVPVYLSAVYDHLYNDSKNVDKIMDLSKNHIYENVFHVIDSPEYKEDGVRYQSKEDLWKIDKLIEKYNEGQNITQIKGIDRNKRIEDVIDKILSYK